MDKYIFFFTYILYDGKIYNFVNVWKRIVLYTLFTQVIFCFISINFIH